MTTEAGRALLHGFSNDETVGDAIAAIEAEAAAKATADLCAKLAAKVRGLDTITVPPTHYQSHPTRHVNRRAVLAIIEEAER